MGKERFSERQTAVLHAAARLDEVAALPETDIVRDALTSHAYDETLAVRIYSRIVHDYAPRLARMAAKIQTLVWD